MLFLLIGFVEVGNQPFGVVSKSSLEPAKDVIFPSLPDEAFQGEEIYKRTHGSYLAGEQRRRNYNWPVDPVNTVFGVKGDTIAFNGVSKNIAQVLNPGDEASIVNQKKVNSYFFNFFQHKNYEICSSTVGGRFPCNWRHSRPISQSRSGERAERFRHCVWQIKPPCQSTSYSSGDNSWQIFC